MDISSFLYKKCAHRANPCALEAAGAAGLGQGAVRESGNAGVKAPVGELEDAQSCLFFAYPDAAPAQDALAGIEEKGRVAEVNGEAMDARPESPGLEAQFQTVSQPLELAVPILPAPGAVRRVGGDEQLGRQSAEPLHFRRCGPDDHPVKDRLRAGRDRPGVTFDLDETEPTAGSRNIEVLYSAEAGDRYPVFEGNPE